MRPSDRTTWRHVRVAWQLRPSRRDPRGSPMGTPEKLSTHRVVHAVALRVHSL